MNFGIYIENVGDHDISAPAFEAANSAVDSKDFIGSALFFQNIGKKPLQNRFGMFNSSEACHFTGKLVVTFLDGMKNIVKEVNDRHIYYYYGLEQKKDLFGLLSVVNNSSVQLIVNNKENFDYIKRVTGITPIAICENLTKITETISGDINE